MDNNFKYSPVSKKEMLKCVKWFKHLLHCRDWDVTLTTQVVGLDALGSCHTVQSKLSASIHINNKKCKESDIHPVQVLVHEMIHVFTNKTSMSINNSEKVSELFEYPLTCLYLGIDP